VAIKHYIGDRIVGLSGDAKPLNVVDGAVFFETDTGSIFNKISGTWVEALAEKVIVSGSDATLNSLYVTNSVTASSDLKVHGKTRLHERVIIGEDMPDYPYGAYPAAQIAFNNPSLLIGSKLATASEYASTVYAYTVASASNSPGGEYIEVLHSSPDPITSLQGTFVYIDTISGSGEMDNMYAGSFLAYSGTGGDNPTRSVYGVVGYAGAYGGGSVKDIVGVVASPNYNRSVSVARAIGLWIDWAPYGSGAGVTTDSYGVLIEYPTTGTNRYNIFSEGTGSVNIFEGDVGIGTTTPTEKLHVVGSILIDKVILSNQENLDVDSGDLRVITSLPSATHDAAFFDFIIKKGTNRRAGTVFAVHNGTDVEFTETSTGDIGNTEEVILSVDLSGGNIRLLAETQTNDWIIKTLVRGL